MYNYTIINKATKKQDDIFGYDYEDACRRAKLNTDDYIIVGVDYID